MALYPSKHMYICLCEIFHKEKHLPLEKSNSYPWVSLLINIKLCFKQNRLIEGGCFVGWFNLTPKKLVNRKKLYITPSIAVTADDVNGYRSSLAFCWDMTGNRHLQRPLAYQLKC